MKIRQYHTKDEKEVIDLWRKCDLVRPWNDPYQDIARKLGIAPDLFLVGTIKNKIIATVMGGYEGHRGWINYLAVDPAYRRKGYATKIMTAIETMLLDKGAPKINLQVRETNKKVVQFYKSLNYKIDDVISLGKRLIKDG